MCASGRIELPYVCPLGVDGAIPVDSAIPNVHVNHGVCCVRGDVTIIFPIRLIHIKPILNTA